MVTTKTVTMNERFHQESEEMRGFRGDGYEDEESEQLRNNQRGVTTHTYSAQFEANDQIATPERDNFMMEEITETTVPVPVSKSSPPKTNMARYKNTTTIKE